jgi:hypothetical protein
MSLDFVGSLPALSPSQTGFLRTDNPFARVADSFKRLSNVGSRERHALIEHYAKLRSTFDYSLFTF